MNELLACHLQKLHVSQLTNAQKNALNIINTKKDIFIALPTGSGKSLIYQLAPHLPCFAYGINKIVVVMPLVSLMEQQASRLASAGYQTIIVADFESGRRALSGENQYIFCSPETLSDVLLSLVIEDRHSAQLIKLVAVDESHCVVKWGQHDKRSKVFRQKFAHIGEFRSVCPEAVYIAMTATATKATETAACNILQMVDYKSIRESPEKLNLRYSVVIRKGADVGVVCFRWLVEEFGAGSEVPKSIVFFKDLGSLGDVYHYLRRRCPPRSIAMFHSGLAPETKTQIVDSFCGGQDSSLRVVLCSSAFSMGMDIPDIERVFHFGVPVEIEDYIQETGRAGRNGERASATIIRHDNTLAGGAISEQMKDYLNTRDCRRQHLLSVFDVKSVHSGGFLCCDNCTRNVACCSCAATILCDHRTQSCFCVRFCYMLTSIEKMIIPSVPILKPHVRMPLAPEKMQELESSLYALIVTSKTVPSNINTIYPSLIENIMKDYQTISSVEDVMELGAFNRDDAINILNVINE